MSLAAKLPRPAKVLRSGADLAAAGLIDDARAGEADAVAERYAVAVTPHIASLIDPADAADPIARQFVPDGRELVAGAAELADPIGDGAHSPVAGIVHRHARLEIGLAGGELIGPPPRALVHAVSLRLAPRNNARDGGEL